MECNAVAKHLFGKLNRDNLIIFGYLDQVDLSIEIFESDSKSPKLIVRMEILFKIVVFIVEELSQTFLELSGFDIFVENVTYPVLILK